MQLVGRGKRFGCIFDLDDAVFVFVRVCVALGVDLAFFGDREVEAHGLVVHDEFCGVFLCDR